MTAGPSAPTGAPPPRPRAAPRCRRGGRASGRRGRTPWTRHPRRTATSRSLPRARPRRSSFSGDLVSQGESCRRRPPCPFRTTRRRRRRGTRRRCPRVDTAARLPAGHLGHGRDPGLDGHRHGHARRPGHPAHLRRQPRPTSFRAQGFVHAQDRFFEMDLRRHITAGRLSELVGEAGVETDTVIRTLGWRRDRRGRSCRRSSRRPGSYLQAYADGVNAYIQQAGPERRCRSSTPSSAPQPRPPRRGLDTGRLASPGSRRWRGTCAATTTTSSPGPGCRATRSAQAQINQLYPPYPYDRHQPILSDAGLVRRASAPRPGPSGRPPSPGKGQAPRRMPRPHRGRPGSPPSARPPTRLVHRALTRSRARRPRRRHRLELVGRLAARAPRPASPCSRTTRTSGVSIPGIWYQVSLQLPHRERGVPLRRLAASPSPGCPVSSSATTQTVAWGFTNLGPDVSDFYLEQVTGDTYLRDGAVAGRSSRTRRSSRSAGGADAPLTVRSTVHGPILSDVVDGDRPTAGRPQRRARRATSPSRTPSRSPGPG